MYYIFLHKKSNMINCEIFLNEYEQMVFFDIGEKEHIKMVRILAFWYTFNMVTYDKITILFDKHLSNRPNKKQTKKEEHFVARNRKTNTKTTSKMILNLIVLIMKFCARYLY